MLQYHVTHDHPIDARHRSMTETPLPEDPPAEVPEPIPASPPPPQPETPPISPTTPPPSPPVA